MRPRLTIARLMAVVAIVAFDCWLVRFCLTTDKRMGTLAFMLPVSFGWVGSLVTGGRLRTFFDGFALAIGGAVAAMIVSGFVIQRPGVLVTPLDTLMLDMSGLLPGWLVGGLWRAPPGTPGGGAVRLNLLERLFVEVCLSLPFLAVAVTGGLIALALRRRTTSTPEPVQT
jgi:hypothetical protein